MSTTASNAPGGPIAWAINDTDVDWLIEAIASASEVVVDLETTGLSPYAWTNGPLNGGVAARIVLASFTLPQRGPDGEWDGVPPTTWVLPLSHPDSPFLGSWRKTLRRIATEVVRRHARVVNQHVKFDTHWIDATTGVDLAPLIFWDTQMSSYLLDENAPTALKERAPRTFGVDRWDDHDLSRPGAAERVDLTQLGEYAARDTWWTWRLYVDHRRRLWLDAGGQEELAMGIPLAPEDVESVRLGRLAETVSMPTVASLGKIERRGILLDVEWARARLAEEEAASAAAMAELCETYGMDPGAASTAPTSHWFRELTERAVAAGDLEVLETTKLGAPRWSKAVLGKLERRGMKAATLILGHKRPTKRAEFLRAWLEYAAEDGTIHSSYRATSVVTGRLSSADPNMQQVTKALRPAFVPRPGYVIADLDYSQIELRVAAYVSRCAPMIEAFNRGEDLHRLIAARVTGKTPDAVTPEERQRGKAANFGLLYLQSAYGFRRYAEDVYGVILSEREAVDFYDGFFSTWDGMKAWHLRTIETARREEQVVSPFGRLRRVPEINSHDEQLAKHAMRAAVNATVQGTASDMMQMAAASIQGVYPGIPAVEGVHLVATVHDSIVAEIREDVWEERVAECQARMIDLSNFTRRLGAVIDVPIVADATVGTRWSLDDLSNPTACRARAGRPR